jgi:FlaA1/EpsC-like NDP-sugar epimerase
MKEGNQPFNAQKALRVACLVLADLILINLSAFLALYIRFEFDLKLLCETEFLHNMIVYSGINSVCTILIFYILKLYNSLWEFAGVSELVRTAVGCFFSAVFYMVGMFMLHLTVPRSFPAIYMLVLCLLCGALRFAYRYARRTRVGLHSQGGRRTMLIGGGQAGAIVLREFQTSPRSENKVVCIIDDSPDKVGSYLRGVKIVGGRSSIPAMAEKYDVDEIVLAIPSASRQEKLQILSYCHDTSCTLRTLPGICQLANGEVRIEQIREVDIEDLRDRERVMQVFDRYRPDLVCHAAAHKHVPLMETSPFEAIKNNVFGTYNVAQAADRFGTQRFILISTDKAVNPTNVMGASKRLCEMIVQMINDRSATEYVAVRFGNVLGSAGSVIPLFRKQIRSGGPVTVTDKHVIRYFMTIPEAVQLIFQAGAYARGGEIFVLDMGEPVCIDDLARNMIRLSGFEPDVDIPIEYTGLRPGEKLYEELLLSGEGMQKTKNDLIYIGHEIAFDPAAFEENLMLLRAIPETDEPALRAKLRELVPTFHAPDGQTLPQEATVG